MIAEARVLRGNLVDTRTSENYRTSGLRSRQTDGECSVQRTGNQIGHAYSATGFLWNGPLCAVRTSINCTIVPSLAPLLRLLLVFSYADALECVSDVLSLLLLCIVFSLPSPILFACLPFVFAVHSSPYHLNWWLIAVHSTQVWLCALGAHSVSVGYGSVPIK